MTLSYKVRAKLSSLIQGEKGTIKKVFGTVPAVAICFPNSYYLGASNLGVHFLYDYINQREDFLAERVFAETLPPVSLENLQPLNRFDIIMFSLSYELDFAGVLSFLKTSGIPVNRRDRSPDDPLVIAGGVAISMNPYPLSDVIDLFIIGDGEETLPLFLETFSEARGDKHSIFSYLQGKTGFLIASDSDSGDPVDIPRSMCSNLDNYPLASVFSSRDTEFADTCLVEITRGCPYRCNFCYVGHNQDPFRTRSLDSIIKIVEQKHKTIDRFGFISSAVTSHPDINTLCKWCVDRNLRISFSSIRAENVSSPILQLLRQSGQKTLTIAPESGSERFRKCLNKNIQNGAILETVERSLELGFTNLKMYFILGLPGEGEKEIQATVDFINQVQKLFVERGKKRGFLGDIIISAGFFVPKPGTPFATAPNPNPTSLRKKQKFFRDSLRRLPHVKIQTSDPYEALAQSYLSRRGREMVELLLKKVDMRLSWKAAIKKWLS